MLNKNLSKILFVSFFLTLILLSASANMVHAIEVTATIPVGTKPQGVAYDSCKGAIFVTNYGSNTVSVISDRTDTVVATVQVGVEPVGVAYDSGKGEVFVANGGSNTVSVISDNTNTVVATIPMGSNSADQPHPLCIAFDSATSEIYVVNSYPYTSAPGQVSVISDSNNTILTSISVGDNPYYAAYDSAKGEIFVTNYGDDFVSVISDSTNAVVANVTLPAQGAYPLRVYHMILPRVRFS
jgi:YVTN family beta-propeller protein